MNLKLRLSGIVVMKIANEVSKNKRTTILLTHACHAASACILVDLKQTFNAI